MMWRPMKNVNHKKNALFRGKEMQGNTAMVSRGNAQLQLQTLHWAFFAALDGGVIPAAQIEPLA